MVRVRSEYMKPNREQTMLEEHICSHICIKERLEWIYTLANQGVLIDNVDTMKHMFSMTMMLSEDYINVIDDEIILMEREIKKLKGIN